LQAQGKAGKTSNRNVLEKPVKRIEVVRHIAADPASVALLLADPTGDSESEQARLHLAAEDGLDVSAPRRSGIGFAADVAVRLRKGGPVAGEIRIEPATDPGCDARIVLHLGPDSDASAAQRLAGKFLSTLADRAKSRSYAA
jgi:hypothetical protein